MQLITGLRIAEMSQLKLKCHVYKEWKLFCENEKKKREKVRGGGGCVQRMKVIVRVRVDVNGEVKLLYFF